MSHNTKNMPAIKSLIDNTARSINAQAHGGQSPEREAVASWILTMFREKQMMRDISQPLFRDRTLQQYLNDNIKRFIQFKRRPAHKKPWQSNLASSTPNEKLIGILARLATKGMECKVRSLEDLSVVEMFRERICNSLLKSAGIKNDDNFQIILEMLEAGEKGTVIGFEDWYHGKKNIREVVDEDPETGEVKFNIKTVKEWNDVRSSLINIEDFYPGNLFVRPGKINDMDDCFLRTVMTEDEFEQAFSKYPDADLVTTKRSARTSESTPFWVGSTDTSVDEVVVLRYFNQKTDEYIIVADDVWINPKGKAEVAPLPWNHKHLPFWGGVYEPLDSNFFYGRSFIDKLISTCDSQDALLDRVLDQMTLAVSKPIITDGSAASALTRGFLQPNNVITTDFTNGTPHFLTVPINDPSPAATSLYQLLGQKTEGAMPSQPGAVKGKNKQATQVAAEVEAANQMTSLFQAMMESAIKDKNSLRFPNQLQFYTLPCNAEEKGARFKKVILRDVELSDGTTGNLQIEINPQFSQQNVDGKSKGVMQNTEFIECTPDFLRNFKYELELVPGSSVKQTEQQRQNNEMNYQGVMMKLYPDKFNRDAGFESMNQAYGKDPNKMKAQTPQQQADMGPGGGVGPAGGKAPAAPTMTPLPAI